MKMMMSATTTTAQMSEAMSLASTNLMMKHLWNTTETTPMKIFRASAEAYKKSPSADTVEQ
jgi:hypothetical protein